MSIGNFRLKKFLWIFFMNDFWISSKKVSDFQQKMFSQPINITFHVSRIQIHFQRRKMFLIFLIEQILQIFFRNSIEKVADLGGSFLAGLAFQRKLHQKNVFLKIVLEFFWTLNQKNFGLSQTFSVWGVRF